SGSQRNCSRQPATREIVSWELAQKYFLDPTFGGALVPGRSNVFASTVDLTGIAFLTEPRHLSPITSRLRIGTTRSSDLDWDATPNWARCSTVPCSWHINGTVVASMWSTGALRWLRCAMKTSIVSRSRWPTSGPRKLKAQRTAVLIAVVGLTYLHGYISRTG